jgi:hypothetical protein
MVHSLAERQRARCALQVWMGRGLRAESFTNRFGLGSVARVIPDERVRRGAKTCPERSRRITQRAWSETIPSQRSARPKRSLPLGAFPSLIVTQDSTIRAPSQLHSNNTRAPTAPRTRLLANLVGAVGRWLHFVWRVGVLRRLQTRLSESRRTPFQAE